MTSAVSTQLRVLGVGVSREWGVHLHGSGLTLAGALVEPILHIAIMCAWFYVLGMRPLVGSSVPLFIATGLYPMFLFVHFSSSTREWARISGAQSRYPSETSLDIILVKSFVRLSVYFAAGVLTFSLLAIFTSEAIPQVPMLIFSSMASVAALGLGMGLINSAVEAIFPVWKYIWGPFARLLIHLSGIIFVADMLPPSYRTVFAMNPLLHAIVTFRRGFYATYPSLIYIPGYTWMCALLVLALGLCLERNYRHLLEK